MSKNAELIAEAREMLARYEVYKRATIAPQWAAVLTQTLDALERAEATLAEVRAVINKKAWRYRHSVELRAILDR
jgi:hypothetical protein